MFLFFSGLYNRIRAFCKPFTLRYFALVSLFTRAMLTWSEKPLEVTKVLKFVEHYLLYFLKFERPFGTLNRIKFSCYTAWSGCVRLGNPDLHLKIWIFGFPIEHKIRKQILSRISPIGNPCQEGLLLARSATKSVFRFCVRLEIRKSRF